MKDWHENADKLAEDADHTEKMTYLKGEMERVGEMRDDIMTSLDMAEVMMEQIIQEEVNGPAEKEE